MQKRSGFFLFCLLVVALVLVGCGADIDRSITFFRNGAWEANIELGLPAELLALGGSPAELEEEMKTVVAEWEEKGARVNWESGRKDTTLIYTFQIEGDGLELLNELIFDNDASITVEVVNGQRQIHFSYFVSRDLLQANSNTLTLIGGEVISSNGEKLNPSTVQWVNFGGWVEAVLTEKSRFSIGGFLGIFVLVGGAIGAGWYWRQQSNQAKTQQEQTVFCSGCGSSLSPQAQFCPYCGHKQT